MFILKKIEYLLIDLHKKKKSSLGISFFTGFIRKISLHPLFRPFKVYFFIIPEVKRIYQKMFEVELGKDLLKQARKSFAMSKKFDRYHAGDYDVLLLYTFIRTLKPEVVIETGIASGRSSTAILSALADNNKGTLYSIDLPKLTEEGGNAREVFVNGKKYFQHVPKNESEPGWLVPEELKKRWVKILGDSNIELPKLVEKLSSIDIFYHDSDHTYETMTNEYETTWPLISKGGFLISDDMTCGTAYPDFLKRHQYTKEHTYNGFGVIKK